MVTKRNAVWTARPRGIWRDPRFVGGLALVALSVLACTWLVSEARAGEQLYVMTRAVAAGEALDATNTRVAQARPGTDAYLPAGSLPEGARATRSLASGELVPASAVSERTDADHRRIVVTVSQGLPDSAGPGTALELWFVPTTRAGQEDPAAPTLVASDVVLVRQEPADQRVPTLGGTPIEVRVGAADLPALLAATGGDGDLTAVPVGG